MRLRKGFISLVVLATVTVAATAALAYACVPQATIRFDRASASHGDQVSGKGDGFAPTVPIEVNLNETRLWLGTPDAQGRFDFAFAAPRLEPGHYVVTAAPVGYAGDPARAVLEITGASTDQPSGAAPAPDPPRGTPSEEPAAPALPQNGGGVGQPHRGAGPERLVAQGPESPAPGPARRGAAGSAGSVGTSSSKSSASRQDRPADRRGLAPARDGLASTGEPGVSVSERSALGDLWNGFADGRRPSLRSTGPVSEAPGASSPFVAGILLLAAGLVTLVGGVGVAEVRRRRRAAHVVRCG
jgi:hypothetical protein